MPEDMSISVNGQSQVPPGFRFHPTEEELLHYYLKKKVSYEKIDLDVIRDVDLNKLEPWDIQVYDFPVIYANLGNGLVFLPERCKIGTTPQNDWYFFSHKDKKYPTGTRTNRATTVGFWKATGRDKVIYGNGRRIGLRKTLVFYKGRAPHGQKSDWIMHEYRLDDSTIHPNVSNVMGEATQEEGWVVCRIFKKKNHHKTLGSPLSSSSIITKDTGTQVLDDHYPNEENLDHILEYIGRTYKDENEANNNSSRFLLRSTEVNRYMKLPSLESPNSTGSRSCYQPILTENESSITNNQVLGCTNPYPVYPLDNGLSNWSALDRLLASHLDGDPSNLNHQVLQYPNVRSSSFLLPSSSNRSYPSPHDYISSEINDLWTFTTGAATSSSSPSPLCHVSGYGV